ncbi:MAG: hypothetical protein WA364_16545 [Candidatus Nitrosopolaris sp.]|jgi:hypothetical protein
MQNNFPMREWHVEHMEKTVLKYVTGLSSTATTWEKKQHKRYARISIVCRQIDYDIKHGVTSEQVLMLLQKIRTHSSFSSLLKNEGSMRRLEEIKEHFVPTQDISKWWR